MSRSKEIIEEIESIGILKIPKGILINLMVSLIQQRDEDTAFLISYCVMKHYWPFDIEKAAGFILKQPIRSWAIAFSKIEGWWPFDDIETSDQIISSHDDKSQAIRWAIADGWFVFTELEFSIDS